MSSDLTTRLRALHAAATPGPWYAHNVDDETCMNVFAVTTNEREPEFECDQSGCQETVALTLYQSPRVVSHTAMRWEADTQLIAEARNALPALCDAADERDALRAQHERDTALCAQAAEDVANITDECVRQVATLTAERDAARNALALTTGALQEVRCVLPREPVAVGRSSTAAIDAACAAALVMAERVAGESAHRHACHDGGAGWFRPGDVVTVVRVGSVVAVDPLTPLTPEQLAQVRPVTPAEAERIWAEAAKAGEGSGR